MHRNQDRATAASWPVEIDGTTYRFSPITFGGFGKYIAYIKSKHIEIVLAGARHASHEERAALYRDAQTVSGQLDLNLLAVDPDNPLPGTPAETVERSRMLRGYMNLPDVVCELFRLSLLPEHPGITPAEVEDIASAVDAFDLGMEIFKRSGARSQKKSRDQTTSGSPDPTPATRSDDSPACTDSPRPKSAG